VILVFESATTNLVVFFSRSVDKQFQPDVPDQAAQQRGLVPSDCTVWVTDSQILSTKESTTAKAIPILRPKKEMIKELSCLLHTVLVVGGGDGMEVMKASQRELALFNRVKQTITKWSLGLQPTKRPKRTLCRSVQQDRRLIWMNG
jgi:hypothetical protein